MVFKFSTNSTLSMSYSLLFIKEKKNGKDVMPGILQKIKSKDKDCSAFQCYTVLTYSGLS